MFTKLGLESGRYLQDVRLAALDLNISKGEGCLPLNVQKKGSTLSLYTGRTVLNPVRDCGLRITTCLSSLAVFLKSFSPSFFCFL